MCTADSRMIASEQPKCLHRLLWRRKIRQNLNLRPGFTGQHNIVALVMGKNRSQSSAEGFPNRRFRPFCVNPNIFQTQPAWKSFSTPRDYDIPGMGKMV